MAQGDGLEKTLRVLSLFERLLQGEVVQKAAEAQRFSVNEKSIQRDIEEIRNYLAGTCQKDAMLKELIYSREKNGYCLTDPMGKLLKGSEVLAIGKVLLESRAFCKEDIEKIIDKLLLRLPDEQKQQVQKIVCNEKFHYKPVGTNIRLIEQIWQLSQAIQAQKLLVIEYKRENATETVTRKIEPQAIVFSEYYFYLIAYICEMRFDFPTIYRVDRIKNMKISEDSFCITYSDRFEDGEFRNRVQFMQTGPLLKVKFKYWGKSLKAILDRLPTAKVLKQDGDCALIEAEVFGRGIKMWFLSQAQYLEVLEPKTFREEMRETICAMVKNYDEN
ncbi:MAG: WYL domain-containing protein [Sporomusaceae bacterium]|nr:WYL domain-containing protein [Sporomusaceae bacterium]